MQCAVWFPGTEKYYSSPSISQDLTIFLMSCGLSLAFVIVTEPNDTVLMRGEPREKP